jgi:23S rRNA pseudouridine1911/1915/1917 synthase
VTVKTLRHDVTTADAGRVDALVGRLLGWPRARVRGLVDHGGVRLGGRVLTASGEPVRAGDVVEIAFDPERRYREKAPERATHGFSLVFADDHLAVVCKDAGLLTVPTERGESQTLVDRLSRHLAKGRARHARVSVVHRLDRETSGLLVFGRTPAVARRISDQFAARKPEREYAAIVAGRLGEDDGEMRSYLATDRALNQRSVARSGGERGELAVTRFRVHERFPDATQVAVRLETGRRNQIRVHFAEGGHPVLGDQRYERDAACHAAWPYGRLALHARVLGFRHPVTGADLRFEAALPAEFEAFRKRMRSGK